MSLLHWANYKGLADYTVDEENPYALPIIVRVEKDPELVPTHEEVQLAVAYAIAAFFDSDKTAPGGDWYNETHRWLEGRIRKIARRARGTEWEKIRSLNNVYIKYGKAEVIILAPHSVSEPLPEVKKLQVSGLDLERTCLDQPTSLKGYMTFSLNPEIEMSTGKTLAQVGHAVQLAIFASDYKTLLSWRDNNTPIRLAAWNSFDGVEVRDAGFTEIEAGSLTAKGNLTYKTI